MQKSLLFLTVFFALIFPCGSAHAFTLPPANDSAYHAIDLGPLPSPGACPGAPKGAYDSLVGTTNNATYEAEQYSSLYPYSNPSPDVWYKFQATGAFIYCELTGLNGWQNFYIKIHYSQGSSITLLPGGCATPGGNFLSVSFPTPTINGEYYLEIGGDSPTNTGDFFLKYKAYNDCGGCVKMATVDFQPAPVFGKYNPGDTVRMCVTMDRYSSLTSSYFHSIVPEFGSDWDVSTLTPVQAPVTQESTGGQWTWFTNINTPNGNGDGFFFDADSDGDPTNNHGDNGQVLSTWTGCWKIVANHPCNSGDLDVMIHLYSDAETGSGSQFSICNPYDAIEVATTSTCCKAPDVTIVTNGNCNTVMAAVGIFPDAASNTDSMNYFLIDPAHHVVQSAMNVIGPTAFNNVPPGHYILWCVNTSSGCTSYVSVVIHPSISTTVAQTATGCGSGTGSAVVTIMNGGAPPFTYNWVNVNATDQNDSAAFNLQDGWVHVLVSDATGCTVQDSVFITSQSTPDAAFDYDPVANCVSTDTIHVLNFPATQSGTYTLLSPQSSGITVDPSNGDIFLNNTTHATPFYVYVSYSVNDICSATDIDSALVVGVPAAPTPASSQTVNWCIGSSAPVLNITVPNLTLGSWYDVQNNTYTVGNSFTPPLNASSLAGTYTYVAFDVSITAGNCPSGLIAFVVNALPPPSVSTTTSNQFICQGDTAFIYTSGCSSCAYQWSPMPTSGIDNLSYAVTSPASTVVYTVNATDVNGCSASAYSAVTVGTCGTSNTFSIYSGLTPNGDGMNDSWIIDGVDSLMKVQVHIFNRWGVEVFENNKYDNVNNVFGGNDQNGNMLTDGTYYYIVTVNDEQHTGWIELSRK